jgi:sulfane dehydrogenase subunit SoxC
MTKKQIELSAKDISAVEKPVNRARLVKAPEHFISQELITDINTNGLDESRRVFLRKGFLSAVGGAAAGLTAPIAFAAGEGDPAIL